jgi:hypothetical protein
MKTISTLAKDKNELGVLMGALYAMGYEAPHYTAESFTEGGFRHVILYGYAGKAISGSSDATYYNKEGHGEMLSVGDFLLEAAKRKFSPPKKHWKVGCRTIEVSADGSALWIVGDQIGVSKSTLEEMLKELK